MATYTDQLLVYVNGRNQKISSSDDLVIGGAFTAASFSGDGASLTNLDAANVATGTLDDARLSANVALYDAAAPTFTNTVSAAGFSGDGSALTSLTATNISGTISDGNLSANVALYDAAAPTFTNTVSAAGFSGDGSALTDLDAGEVSTGTMDDARLSANVALYDAAAPTFTNTVSAAGFSGDGSALTDLDADELTSGTVDDARLSANVPLLNAASNNFSGDMHIGGDLTVDGAIVSTSTENVIIGDAFLDLLAANTSTAAAQAGGFTVTVQAVGSAFTATAFYPGVAGVSNPYFDVSSDPTAAFAVGDILSISGSTDSKNDGQYVVLSRTTTTVTVKGIGTTGVSAQTPFAHNQFVSQTGETANVTKAAISVIAASNGSMSGPAGAIAAGTFAWNYASPATEAAFTGSWKSLDVMNTISLQAAYDGGATITLAGSSDLVVSKPTSGSAAISLEANAASDITIDGAALTISASQVNVDDQTVFADSVQAGSVATTSGVAAGDLVYVDTSGVAQLADGDAVSYAAREVDGVFSGVSGALASFYGQKVVVKYAGSAPGIGDMLYLSATAGQGTATLPTSGRVTQLGRVVVGGAGGVCTVIWKPQYIADLD